MGTAHADPVTDIYAITPASLPLATCSRTRMTRTTSCSAALGNQGIANSTLDISDAQSNLTGYESFVTDVAAFEQTASEHGLENLIYAIDPSAFYEQTTAGITGTLAGGLGATWFRTDFLGYLATGLDYGLLTPDRSGLRPDSADRHPDWDRRSADPR